MLGILEGKEGMVKRIIPKKNCLLRDVVAFYLKSEDFLRLTARSQKEYEANLQAMLITVVEGRALGDYRSGNLRVRHLTQAYEYWLSSSGIRTANYRKAALSVAWRHAMRYDIMQHDPVALVKTQQTKPRKVKWKREHLRSFLSVAYSDFRWRSIGLIVHMAYDWGQRVGDMRVMTWDSLDLEACRLDLTQSKRNADVHLPISNNLCKMLRQQKEEFGFQKYVAPNVTPSDGAYKPYRLHQVSNHINSILAEANLPRELTAMDLRRTAVTEMMEAGVDLVGIMQVTGHRNPNSVKPYMVNTFSGASKALAARGNDTDDD